MINNKNYFTEDECTANGINLVWTSKHTCSGDETDTVCVKHSVEGEDGIVHKCVGKNAENYKTFFANISEFKFEQEFIIKLQLYLYASRDSVENEVLLNF